MASLEFFIGKLRALSAMLTSKSFMINIEDYRGHIQRLVKQLITTIKEVRRHFQVNNIQELGNALSYLNKLEDILAEYFSFVSDKTIKLEKLVDINSEKLTVIIQNINDFNHDCRILDDYSDTIEEIYFLKNKLIEAEKIEKTVLPQIKEQSSKIKTQEIKINELIDQLDKAEKNVFDFQTKVTSFSEEKDQLQERIQELIEKAQSPDQIIFDEEKIAEMKDENKRLKEDVDILTRQLNEKLGNSSKESIDNLETRISDLKNELQSNKEINLNKISKLVEERNVWRSRAIQNQVYSIEEAIAEIKKRISDFEKENRDLIEEKENLLKKLKGR